MLKVQILEPEISELELIKRFNQQNDSCRIRLPQVYDHKTWSKQDGFGWMMSEQTTGQTIETGSPRTHALTSQWCDFYGE